MKFRIPALLTTGKSLIQDLEREGAVAAYAPLEGGYEGRYRRRIRTAGYTSLSITARGLGDLSMYLTGVHGVRPPHLGKKGTTAGAAVGDRYFVPPIVDTQLEHLPPNSKGLLLWIIEGYVLSSEELTYLTNLVKQQPKLKIVIEMGGAPTFQWKPLKGAIAA
jgi:NAD(P)H-quinone oxidoreductase subunit N